MRFVRARLGCDEGVLVAGLQRHARVDGERADEIAVVEAQVAFEVGGVRQRPSAFAERFLKSQEMQALGIRQDTVEIEDDRAGPAHLAAGSRSPARMGAASRFSRGGTGHS